MTNQNVTSPCPGRQRGREFKLKPPGQRAPWTCTGINCWKECLNKISKLEYAHRNIYHIQMQLINIHNYHYVSCTAESIMHSNKHSSQHVHFNSSTKYSCRSKIGKIAYLMMKSIHNQLRRCNVPPNHRPACSLISQQHCHPWAGHDSPRNKGTSRFTHSQGYTKHTAKPTKLGLSGH